MKKIYSKLIFIFLALSSCLHAIATVRTVNNAVLPVPPGQYANIGDAIAAASDGDTIIVAGSPIPYDAATISITKKLVLIGNGYNPKGANPYSTKTFQFVNISCSGSGSTITGFEFHNEIHGGGGGSGCINYSNITFTRNYFVNSSAGGGVLFNFDSCINIKFINNIFGALYYAGLTSPWVYNCAFYNNVFLHDASLVLNYPSSNCPPVIIDHNLFMCGYHMTPTFAYPTYPPGSYCNAISPRNALISNNIFYNNEPFAPPPASPYYFVNNTLINNITFVNGATLPSISSNPYSISSGNLDNTDPLLNSIFNSSVNVYLDFKLDNIGLQAGSPAINAASDGTNIGPTGGLYPIYNTDSNYLTGEPALPEVRKLNVTGSSTIESGATLNVNITGKKMN